jgi:tetratricopeptide (TPR) repeat protein
MSLHGSLSQVFDPETLLVKGREARAEHRLVEAQELYAQAVAECRWVKNPPLLAKALNALGQVERDLHHSSTAIDCYRQAAAIYRELDAQVGLAHTIRHIADILREQKRSADAEKAYNEALEIYRSNPDAPGLDLANALRGFALLKDGNGAGEEALLLWQEASYLYAAAGVEAGVSECKMQIAFLMGQ